MEGKEVYTEYVPFSDGAPHEGVLQETMTLSYVTPAKPTYALQFPVLKNALSNAQIDCVTLALESHGKFLSNGDRKGFYIGDGAGVGKGRELAAIIAENFYLGREKAVWLTCSETLFASTECDLRDVHKDILEIPLFTLGTRYEKVLPKKGVLFCLYTTLTSKSRSNQTRMDIINTWLGENFEGVIIMDECHRAKNCELSSEDKLSKIGYSVIELQKAHKLARIVYSSATGVSEVGHLGYMTRLGLFGTGCAFKDADSFTKAITSSGVSCMELLGIQLKSNGLFLSRVLSMQGIKYDVRLCENYDKKFYNESALLWTKMLQCIYAAKWDRRTLLNLLSKYWGSHQRFYTFLTISSKVDEAIQITREKTKTPGANAVVIGLQNTGESYQQEKGGTSKDISWFSSTRVILEQTAKVCCAIDLEEVTVAEKTYADENSDKEGQYNELEDFENNWKIFGKTQRDLEKEIKSLYIKLYYQFPANPLDYMIEQLGGHSRVAELTGRFGGYVRNANGNLEFKLLRLNRNAEIVSFQSGKKDIAIITDACSVGISLHDEVVSSNPMKYTAMHRKRTHITIQCPWSAVKMVQQLGRTHKTKSASLPDHIFLLSDISAESRVMSSISERIHNMGALTQADQKAGYSSQFANEMHGKYGRQAIRQVCATLTRATNREMKACKQALEYVGVLDKNKLKRAKAQPSIFLNRLIGCPVFIQKILLTELDHKLADLIEKDKKNNIYDQGIQSFNYGVGASAGIINEESFKFGSGNIVILKTVRIDRTMRLRDVRAILRVNKSSPNIRPFEFYLKDIEDNLNPRAVLGFPLEDGDVMVYQASNCEQTFWSEDDLYDYRTCTYTEAKPHWENEGRKLLSGCCIHTYEMGSLCTKAHCQEGKAVFHVYVVCGSLIAVWPTLMKSLGINAKRKIQAATVLFSDNSTFVGLLVPTVKVDRLRTELQTLSSVEYMDTS